MDRAGWARPSQEGQHGAGAGSPGKGTDKNQAQRGPTAKAGPGCQDRDRGGPASEGGPAPGAEGPGFPHVTPWRLG